MNVEYMANCLDLIIFPNLAMNALYFNSFLVNLEKSLAILLDNFFYQYVVNRFSTFYCTVIY